jgi:GNAT superfamily N-acetyltransferase
MNHSNMTGAYQFVAFYKHSPVAFCSVITQPHPKAKNILRVHRLVTLPDYQGVGIGGILLDFVADYYIKLNKRFRIVTSTPSLAYSLNRNNHWQLKAQGRQGVGSKTGIIHKKGHIINDDNTMKVSANRITTTWEYK